jgi:hypothetical protein
MKLKKTPSLVRESSLQTIRISDHRLRLQHEQGRGTPNTRSDVLVNIIAISAHCPSAFVSGLVLFERHWLREACFKQEKSDPQNVSLLQPDWNQS